MTKRVVSLKQVYHLWAHQSQTSAWNSSRSVSFDGAIAYSYRTEIGAIFKNKRGQRLVLVCSDRFSITTTGHQSCLRRAVSHLPSIECPHVIPKWGSGNSNLEKAHHDLNLTYFVKEMERLHKEAGRVLRKIAVQWRAEHAAQLHKDMTDYMLFFGIRRKVPALLSFAAAYERVRQIENPDPASLAKRERARAQRKQAEYARNRLAEIDRELGVPLRRLQDMAYVTNWRLFGAFGNTHALSYIKYDMPPALRVNGDEIETSYGARIPLDHAPRIWRAVQRVIASGKSYVRNGHTEYAGTFAIDRIEPDGTLIAGCHTIPASELRTMARQLRLA